MRFEQYRVVISNMQRKMLKICWKNGFLVFGSFKLVARISKCDFWNPGEISDWYRKKSTIFFQDQKKSLKNRKHIFLNQKKPKTIFGKVNREMFFKNVWNFEIPSFYWLFQIFFDFFWPRKSIFRFFSENFLILEKKSWIFSYINPKLNTVRAF